VTRIYRFPALRVEQQEQVAAWIARLDRGLRGSERLELRQWLAEKSGRREDLLEAARIWDRLDMLEELAELFPLNEQQRPWRFAQGALIAAALVVAVGAAALWFRFDLRPGQSALVTGNAAVSGPDNLVAADSAPPSPYVASYATGVGEQRTVELPDRSIIRLNTNTVLRAEFTATARMLQMSRGEASFQVAKDPQRLFTVRVAGIDFNAIGTAFDIRTDWPGGVRLAVTEGRVRVRPAPQVEPGNAGASQQNPVVARDVVANSGLVIEPSGASMAELELPAVVAATAWHKGMVAFDATPLDQVVTELARYSTTRFVLEDPDLGKLLVSGYFKLGDLEALSVALERNFGISMRRSDNVIVLSADSSR
jgi:transmembrane sensor